MPFSLLDPLPKLGACHKVVRNSIQKLMDDSKTRTNMLCVGYDEETSFDLIDEALCTHAWDILLERIGDRLMVFLLKFSSIFLPLTNKCYQQVTGPPLTEILQDILNEVDSDNNGSVLLLNHIFGLSVEDFECGCHKGVSGSSLNCLYHYLLGLLKSLIRNVQNCPYKKLLLKHCPLPVLTQLIDEGKGSTCEVEGASGFYAPKLDIAECYSKRHQGKSTCIEREKIYHLLSEHLKYNILKNGEKFYLQKVGICQGSSISSLLCSFYLGHLERSKILPYLEKDGLPSANILNEELLLSKETLKNYGLMSEPSYNDYYDEASARGDIDCIRNSAVDVYQDNVSLETEHWHQRDHTRGCSNDVRHENLSSPNNLLLRLIDDFLFISTSKEQAKMFFNRMYKGFEEYNCNMNNTKFCLNFDLGQSKPILNRLYIGADGIQFLPWSGLLINCQTLEIQADYTRYLNIHVSSTITVQADDNIGSSLKDKLCDYMRPKCHPIFYDSNINSSVTVRLNAYQAFLLCAMKFHCYVCSISDNNELNPSYLVEIIERSFRYMYKLVKKQIILWKFIIFIQF